MPRSVSEWIGRTDDTPVPPRVRLRVLERFGRRCDPRLINGGANRESNLHPLCEWCEPPKTEADVHEKSRSHRKRLRYAALSWPQRAARFLARSPAAGNTAWMAAGSRGPGPALGSPLSVCRDRGAWVIFPPDVEAHQSPHQR
jgi:5-methylcytosine-specific restriction protein A